MKTLVS